MAGHIRCASHKCRKHMSQPICPHCGSTICYIVVYWQGKHYEFKRDRDNDFFTYNKAIRKLNAIRLAIDEKRFDPADWLLSKIKERTVSHKLSEWLQQKEEEVENNEFAPSTLAQYKGYINNYFVPFLGNIDVREVTFETLENFKDSLGKVKVKTRRNILNALHAFYTWLYRKDVVKTIPPFPQIEGDDSTVKVAMEYEDQVENIQKIPTEHRNIFEFGFETGLRVSELCALKVKDCDIKKGIATIQRTYSYGILRETTKSKNKKPIPLSDRAYDIASKHSHGKHPETFLFINPVTGRGYKRETLRDYWQKYTNRPITLYEAVRHSFCTQIVENGADLYVAQILMRHSDIRSTQKYFHANVLKLRDIVNKRGKGKVVSIELSTKKSTTTTTNLQRLSGSQKQ